MKQFNKIFPYSTISLLSLFQIFKFDKLKYFKQIEICGLYDEGYASL